MSALYPSVVCMHRTRVRVQLHNDEVGCMCQVCIRSQVDTFVVKLSYYFYTTQVLSNLRDSSVHLLTKQKESS